MSWEFTTANAANYLLHDAGSDTSRSSVYSKVAFFKIPSYIGSGNSCFFSHGGTSNTQYAGLYVDNYPATHEASIRQAWTSFAGAANGRSVGLDQWYGIAMTQSSSTSRKLYITEVGTAYSSSTNDTNDGGDVDSRYAAIGVQYRDSAGISMPAIGKIARCALWYGTALTDQNIQDIFDGTIEPSALSTNLYGYWKGVNGALTDGSGNGRTMVMTGTVGSSTDEPFPDAFPYARPVSASLNSPVALGYD